MTVNSHVATIVFDIETSALPLETFDEAQQEYLFRELEKLAEGPERETKRAEIQRQFNLWPFTAQVVCVAMLNADTQRGQVLFLSDDFEDGIDADKVVAAQRSEDKVEFMPCADEAELLTAFWDVAKHYDNVVTFNGRGFDVPFIYLRSALLNVPISKKNWLGYRFATDERMRDLALCQNEAAAYGKSSFMQGEQKVSWAIIDSMAESARENKIIETCMIAKGYSLVDKNSPLLTNSQPTLLFNDSPELTAKIIGHWESTSFKAKQMEQGVEIMAFDFFPKNRLLQTTIEKGKSYPSLNYYTIRGDKIAIWEPMIDAGPKQNDYANFSLVDDQMVISLSDFQMVLQRGSTNHQQTAQSPETSIEISGRHWSSVLKATNGVIAATIDYYFLPQHRYSVDIDNKLRNIEQHEEGLYYYDGKKLVTWCDKDAKPEVFGCSISEDSMKYSPDGRIIFHFTKLPE